MGQISEQTVQFPQSLSQGESVLPYWPIRSLTNEQRSYNSRNSAERVNVCKFSIFLRSTAVECLLKFSFFVQVNVMTIIGRDWRIAEAGNLGACFSYPL
jgi:hypothetical protein